MVTKKERNQVRAWQQRLEQLEDLGGRMTEEESDEILRLEDRIQDFLRYRGWDMLDALDALEDQLAEERHRFHRAEMQLQSKGQRMCGCGRPAVDIIGTCLRDCSYPRPLVARVAQLEDDLKAERIRRIDAEERCAMCCEEPADNCGCAGCLYAQDQRGS